MTGDRHRGARLPGSPLAEVPAGSRGGRSVSALATHDPAATRRLAGLTWAHLLNDGAANYLPGVLPAVLAALHEPIRIAGVLIAALTVGQALQPVVGWVGDRIGGRSLVVAGLVCSSVGGGLLGVAHSLGLVIALLMLIGLGSALFHPQALAGVRSVLRGRRALLTSVFLVGGELGRGVWPTAASLVAANLGLAYLWIIALPGLATAALLVRWAPDLPRQPRAGAVIAWKEHGRPLAMLIAYQGIRALALFGLATFIPLMWHVRGGTLVAGASIITTMTLVGVVGNLGGGHVTDRLGRRFVLVASALATAGLVPTVAYLHGAVVWLVSGLLGVALFLSASTTVLIGQDIFPENRSMGSGVALGLANGIGAVLVLLSGLLVSERDVVTVFWLLSGLSLVSTIPALSLPRLLTR